MNHEQTFAFPPRPVVSRRCMDLIANLVCNREGRLSSKQYRIRDTMTTGGAEYHVSTPGTSRTRMRPRDGRGRAVYPHDAEDIKAHKWFRDIPWDQLHMITPPFVPQIGSVEDTHYFDEEEPISDWSDSSSDEDEDEDEDDDGNNTGQGGPDAPAVFEANPLAQDHALSPAFFGEKPTPTMTNQGPFAPPPPHPIVAGIVHNGHPSTAIRRSPQKTAAMQAQLAAFPRHARGVLAQFVATPYDSIRLKRMDREIDAVVGAGAGAGASGSHAPTATTTTTTAMVHQQFQQVRLADDMKAFVRAFGRRERKRPRDRLLRDRRTKATVLRVRKQMAFLGYTFRRAADVVDASAAAAAAAAAISTLDGAELGTGAGAPVYLQSGMPGFARYGGLEPGGAMTMEMGMGLGLEMVGAGGAGFAPGDAAHVASYRALHQEAQRGMGMGW